MNQCTVSAHRSRRGHPGAGQILSDTGTNVPDVTDDHSQQRRVENLTPARPRSMDPQELGFTPQRQIGWLAPLLLLSTGLRTLLAVLFGAYLDKRELQNALDGGWFDHSATEDGEIWLDYVAD